MIQTGTGVEVCPNCRGNGEIDCCDGSPSLVEEQVKEVMESGE